MADLPNGLDRADGLSGRLGTATPAHAIQVITADGSGVIPIEELEDSPEIERAEQGTITHRYRMNWNEAKTRITFYGRGTVLVDGGGNVTKVLSAKIQHEKPDNAIMTIVAESLSFDTPPDTFSIVEVELGVNIIKYPRYFYALKGATTTEELLNQDVIRNLQNYFENVTPQYRDALTFQLNKSFGNPGTISGGNIVHAADIVTALADGTSVTITPIAGTDLAKAAALEVIQKYWRNEENPYIVGYEITWSSYYFRPPYLNPGGYTENPITEAVPALPDYFWSPDFPPSAATIFDQLTTINPQNYSSTGVRGGPLLMSWLRKADREEEQRTWFKIDRRWIGSPVGFWDEDLYNSDNRPLVASDYSGISIPQVKKADVIKAAITDFRVS